jgi:hypothetical protein
MAIGNTQRVSSGSFVILANDIKNAGRPKNYNALDRSITYARGTLKSFIPGHSEDAWKPTLSYVDHVVTGVFVCIGTGDRDWIVNPMKPHEILPFLRIVQKGSTLD